RDVRRELAPLRDGSPRCFRIERSVTPIGGKDGFVVAFWRLTNRFERGHSERPDATACLRVRQDRGAPFGVDIAPYKCRCLPPSPYREDQEPHTRPSRRPGPPACPGRAQSFT